MPTLSELFNLDPKVERLSLMPRMRGSLGSDYGVSPEMQNSVMFEGKKGFMPDVIAPKVLYDFIRAIKAPGRAARGEVLDEEEALNTALNMFGGGLATSGGVPAGSLGMFIGPKSPAFNKEALKTAIELEKAGVSKPEIWKQTMTARGLDKQWRQEIPDVGANLDMAKVPSTKDLQTMFMDEIAAQNIKLDPNLSVRGQLGEDKFNELYTVARTKYMDQPTSVRLTTAFQHPELEEAYPNLVGNLQIAKEQSVGGVRGKYDPQKKLVTTGGSEITDDQSRSTLLHEVQHAIQDVENWGRGGSPDSAKAIAAAQIKSEVSPLVEPFTRNRNYWEKYGEAARSEYMVRLGELANRSNIKPRAVYRLQDWDRYGNEYRREAGPQPKKPGPARDAWFQGAADYIRQQNVMTDPRYAKLPFDNVRDAKNAQRRAMTQIKKTDEAAQEFSRLGQKQKLLNEMTDVEAYRRLAGEAEARLTQRREKLSMDERRANYPFAEQYEKTIYENGRKGSGELMNPYGLDVPRDETFAYTQFGTGYNADPMMQFLGSNAPVDDPLMRFLSAPQGK
jgi:hypothetical protein